MIIIMFSISKFTLCSSILWFVVRQQRFDAVLPEYDTQYRPTIVCGSAGNTELNLGYGITVI